MGYAAPIPSVPAWPCSQAPLMGYAAPIPSVPAWPCSQAPLMGYATPIPSAPDRVDTATVNLVFRPRTRVGPTARMSWPL